MILTTTIPTVVTNVTKPKLNFSIDQLVNKDNVLKKSSTKYISNSDNNVNNNQHLSIMSSSLYNDNHCINTPSSINNYQNEQQKDYGKEIAKALRISTYDDLNQTLSFNTTTTINNKSPITTTSTTSTSTASNEQIKYSTDNIKLPSPPPNDIYTNNTNNNNNLIRPLPIIPTNSDRSNASSNTNSNNNTNNTNISNNNSNSNTNNSNSHNNEIQQSLTTMYQSQLLAAQLQMITKMMSSQSHHPGMQSNHNIPLNKDDEQLAQFRNKFNYQHIPHLINGDVQNTMYQHQNPHPLHHHHHHHPHAHPSIQPWAINRHGRIFSHRFTGDFLLHPFRKPKRIRTAFAPLQLLKLEHAFEGNQYVVGSERKALAKTLNLTETQVKVWFQNRRTKHKRMQQDDALNTKNISDDETDNRSSSSSAYKSYNNNNSNNMNNGNNHHHNNDEMYEEDDDEDDDDNESIELDVVTNCHDDIDL